MAEEMKKNDDIMDGQGETEDDFEYDPEKGGNAKLRLPFALCKERGIPIQDWWTPRDAWDALKNGGYIDDVDEEYAKILRDDKRKKEKEWREDHPERVRAWQERAKIKKAQLKDPNHNPDRNYAHVDGAIAGVKKGKPMTHEQADSGNVNPYYSSNQIGYRTNCQTCVATYAARLQGYDVRALPNLNNRDIYQLSYNPGLAFVDENGQHPKSQEMGRRDILGELPPNTLRAVKWQWGKRRSGHIVIMGNDGNGTYMYDPQTNVYMNQTKQIRKYTGGANNFSYYDLSGCRMDETYCDKVMKGGSKK